MPIKEFESFVKEIRDDADIGFFFEVDLEVPIELHDKFKYYPLAPQHGKRSIFKRNDWENESKWIF